MVFIYSYMSEWLELLSECRKMALANFLGEACPQTPTVYLVQITHVKSWIHPCWHSVGEKARRKRQKERPGWRARYTTGTVILYVSIGISVDWFLPFEPPVWVRFLYGSITRGLKIVKKKLVCLRKAVLVCCDGTTAWHYSSCDLALCYVTTTWL